MASPPCPIVLIHPLGSDANFWHSLYAGSEAVTAVEGDLLAVDLPGHGTSLFDAERSIDAMAGAVMSDLSAQGVVRADVVGVSLGGIVAQVIAAGWPGFVRRLVLASTTARYPDEMRESLLGRALTSRALGLAALAGSIEDAWFTAAYRDHSSEIVERQRQTLLSMDAEAYARACEAMAAVDITRLAKSIAAPTLVVCGRDDSAAFRNSAAWLQAEIPDSEMCWIDGKHAAVLESAGEFTSALAGFLQSP